MIQETIKKLRQLRLPGMIRTWEALRESGADRSLASDEIITRIVDSECEERYLRKVDRNIKNSHLRLRACFEELEASSERGFDKTMVSRLMEGEWMNKPENIIITGATGTGKSFIACALGHFACTREKRVIYYATSKLTRALRESQADNTFTRIIKNIARHQVLILDDFGLDPFTPDIRRWIFEIIEDRYGLGSTIIVSQLPLSVWPEMIGEPTLADAIIDRLVHNAQVIELREEKQSRRAKKKLR